ncbi:hypothetical protein [Nocardia brasiliensis]|uniref:hypothetical protein n=1 Tax=Nocardia brasiliensis TaxID=37326 RepID=UPI00366E9E1F
MRAEYVDGSSPQDPNAQVKMWHVVPLHDLGAMCGRMLDPESATQPADALGTAGEPSCPTCSSLYLREVPSFLSS